MTACTKEKVKLTGRQTIPNMSYGEISKCHLLTLPALSTHFGPLLVNTRANLCQKPHLNVPDHPAFYLFTQNDHFSLLSSK